MKTWKWLLYQNKKFLKNYLLVYLLNQVNFSKQSRDFHQLVPQKYSKKLLKIFKNLDYL